MTVTAFAVPTGSLDYWKHRLSSTGVDVEGPDSRFADRVIAFRDYDGMRVEFGHPRFAQRPARGGAALLSPRGKSLENGMNRFFRRLAMGVLDIEDLKFRTGELADFVESAVKQYSRDPAKVIALGYSNGVNIAASMLLLPTAVLAGAVLMRPIVPLVPEQLPALHDRPIWIGGGKRETVVGSATS